MPTKPYSKTHILDFVIDDEARSGDWSVSVDSHEKVIIEIGDTCTIRTDEEGVDLIRDALHRALVELENVRYERVTAEMNRSEDDMIQAGIDAREDSKLEKMMKGTATPAIDVFDNNYNPNDPVNW